MAAFAITHDDHAPPEIDILQAQAKAFHQAHAGAKQQARHQRNIVRQAGQQALHLGRIEHHRQPHPCPRPSDAIKPRKINPNTAR